jgi:hypothetical protein
LLLDRIKIRRSAAVNRQKAIAGSGPLADKGA